MKPGALARRIGRVVVDDDGIAQKPILGLFGERFSLRWSEVSAWTVREMVLAEPTTGKERVVSRVLSLYWEGGVHFITRSARDREFQSIVDAVREQLPSKELKADA